LDNAVLEKQDLASSIVYVSETGNAKFLAEKLAKYLKEKSVKVKLKASESYRLLDLKKETNLILISSTHGEGEVPENGKELFEHLIAKQNLENINFAIIALGDSSYPLFCKSGKDFSKLLKESKAKELVEPILLDLDFENHIANINEQLFHTFANIENSHVSALPKTNNKTQITGEVATNINLNDIGSTKETRHIEIIADEPINYTPGDSVSILLNNEELGIKGPITPRQYSIASSPALHENEIHLTVSVVRYVDEKGQQKEGLFSSYLSKLKEGQKITFKVSPNRKFSLPENDNTDIIMVGAGTGIAPFRSFLAQRSANSVQSKSWLFFGERNFQSDFLYQTEIQEFLANGSLTKIDVAFSRDQKEKIYVQDKIKQQGKEIFQWLENGAHFYICGDKTKMAKDVESTLLEIIKANSKTDPQQYLTELTTTGRYLKDVY
jgi:sulfite reductase (NADPH) flavoprotein alpha-component